MQVYMRSMEETPMGGTVRPAAEKLLSMYQAMFFDISRTLSLDLSLDWTYLKQRIAAEGESFALANLPLLGKAAESSLITGERLKVPLGFSLVKGTRLPKFLNKLFQSLFEGDGLPKVAWKGEYVETQWQACRFIRQVTMAFSKVEHEANQDTVKKALKGFSERISAPWTPEKVPEGRLDEIRKLISRVLQADDYNQELREFLVEPWGRHGPGAVAERERGTAKWSFKKWPGVPSRLFEWARTGDIPVKDIPEQPIGRVVDVPKDFRGPRIICIEPKENQFAQQGLMEILFRFLTRHPLTRRAMDFWDVRENRAACFNNMLATIDLKDASDRIHIRLTRILFPAWFFQLVTRFRTRKVLVDGEIRRNNAFATMGSAICFPIESFVFWAISLGTMIHIRDGWPRDKRVSLPFYLKVFGDDIILPIWAADEVCHTLECLGLRVNLEKTCLFTPVRESCGEWVFLGRSIEIVRFRSIAVEKLRHWVQWVDYAKSCNLPAMKQRILDELFAYLPVTSLKRRWNRSLQRKEVRLPFLIQDRDGVSLPNYQGLYAWQVGNDRMPHSFGARKRVKWKWTCEHEFFQLVS